MPPTVKPISNLKNFRGNVLDRQFPVQFDPSTGMYSYDYVELTPEVTSKLKNLKYFRKSSKDLAEIEADLAAYLAKEGPAAPRAKGEITKAAEEEIKKFTNAGRVLVQLSRKQMSGQPLSAYEQKLLADAGNQSIKSFRPKKVEFAKKHQEALLEAYNAKVLRKEPVEINDETKRPKLSAEDQDYFNFMEQVKQAAKYLDDLDEKEKKGTALTPGEETEKAQKADFLDRLVLPPEEMQTIISISKNVNEKGLYNAAKATYTQLKNIPTDKLNISQRGNIAKAWETMMMYERAHPEVATKATEQRNLQRIELMRKNIKAINAKPQPITPEDQAEKTRLEGMVAAYNATHARDAATYNVENTSLEENELQRLYEGKVGRQAQKVLNYFTSPAAPKLLSKELTNLRNTAQRVKNALAKLNNKNASNKNKNTARKTIKNSNFVNQAKKLSVPTEGGRRRTRKVRRSRRTRRNKY
jgi:hypothetical protein